MFRRGYTSEGAFIEGGARIVRLTGKTFGLLVLVLLSACLAQGCPICDSHSYPSKSDNSISFSLQNSYASNPPEKLVRNRTPAMPSQSCGACEEHSAFITDLVFCNATDAVNGSVSLHSAQAKVNYTYCGCPNLTNTAVVNSTDLFGTQVGPKTVFTRLNFTYTAAFNASKTASVVYNLTELGDKLVLLEYNITVNNAGNVNITGVEVNDSLLGAYPIGKLTPGQTATILPRYTVNKSQIRYCFVNNTANITGTDRCCKMVNISINNSFPINLAELEDILHQYNATIEDYVLELKVSANTSDIEKLEGILRNQTERISTFEDLLHDAWPYIPD